MTTHTQTFVALFAALAGTASAALEATPAPEIDRFVATATRAEVVAATAEARRAGLVARNDYEAQRLAQRGFVPQLTREQVRAETVAARRFGLTSHGEAGAPAATDEQLAAIRHAGLRGADDARVAGRR